MTAKTAAILSLLVLVAGTLPARAADEPPKDAPRPRVLYVFAPDADNKPLLTEYDQIQQAADALDDKDIITVFVIGDRRVKLPPPDSRYEEAVNVRKHYHIDAAAFRVVLVGRDGWEKKRWSEPVEPREILSHANELPRPKDEDSK